VGGKRRPEMGRCQRVVVHRLAMATTRDHVELEKRRQQAAGLFAKGRSAPEVARHLGVARQVAYRWKDAFEEGGKNALASKGPAGRKTRLAAGQMRIITQALLAGPVTRGHKTARWTLPQVADLIADLAGVCYHPGHVWRLLRAIGLSCQRPERRAIEGDRKAMREWQRVEWPDIKKTPPARPDPRLY